MASGLVRRSFVMELSRYTQNAIKALSGAQECAKEFVHRFVGSEHLLMGILNCGDKTAELLNEYGIDRDSASPFVDSAVGERNVFTDSFGNTQAVKRILELALYEAKSQGAELIDTRHILLSIMRERDSMGARMIDSICTDPAALKAALSGNESEQFRYYEPDEEYREPVEARVKNVRSGSSPVLDEFSVDMTALAREGKLDPVIGRDNEITRVLQTLCRRSKNNAVLIGDPGVGKTAVAEGIAIRIAEGRVPQMLAGSRLISLDISSMVAGTKYRGEFEERLKSALDELKSDESIIVFIDEIHNIVGAGSGEGSLDAANIMKPALARGELRVIGATTVEEYRRFIEKDAALERRFTPILISEPDADQMKEILAGLKQRYEKHHGLIIDREAVDAAIDLSVRCITDRRLPDKAIDLIDEACARRSMDIGAKESYESAAEKGDYELAKKLRDSNRKADNELPHVSSRDIAQVVSEKTGIGIDLLLGSERFIGLEKKLSADIFGQDNAVKTVSAVLRRSAAGLSSRNKPFASFIIHGPKGTGKRSLVVHLAEEYAGCSVIRLNGNDFSDEMSAVRLIGAPAGYKDSEKGGLLTEFVKLHPVSVIMIASPEKLDHSAISVIADILENGCIEDGRGRQVSFRNAVIALIVDDRDRGGRVGFASSEPYRDLSERLFDMLPSSVITEADEIVPFERLGPDSAERIVRKLLDGVSDKAASKGIELAFDDKVVASIASSFSGNVSGIGRRISLLIEDPLSIAVLNGELVPGDSACFDDIDGKYIIRKVERQ